jgi:hypothetical protein
LSLLEEGRSEGEGSQIRKSNSWSNLARSKSVEGQLLLATEEEGWRLEKEEAHI